MLRNLSVPGCLLAVLACSATLAPAQEPVETLIERIIGFCNGGSQLCDPPFTIPVETGGELMVQYFVPPSHCSSLRVHVFVDGVPQVSSGYLGWEGAGGAFSSLPLETAVMDLGPLSPGAHVLEIQAEGQASGCNHGSLGSWAGGLQIGATTLGYDQAVEALGRLAALVESLELPAGFGGHLTAPLDAAIDRLSDDNLRNDMAACGALTAFQAQVRNQLRYFLPVEAARLMQQPDVIAASLGCL